MSSRYLTDVNTMFIDKLAFIELQNHQILSTRSRGKDTWYIPGGKRESNETDAEALIREVREELSIDLNEDSLRLIGIFSAQAHGKPEGVLVRMTCYTGAYSGTLQPAAEIEEMRWMSYADRAMGGPVDKVIFDFLKVEGLLH